MFCDVTRESNTLVSRPIIDARGFRKVTKQALEETERRRQQQQGLESDVELTFEQVQ